MRRLFSLLALVACGLLVATDAKAQPTTDARDYEGAGLVPNNTVVLANYLRHQTTSQKRNLTTNLSIFRATYVMRFGNLAIVPFDALLPVADADLRLYTNPAAPMAGPTSQRETLPFSSASARASGIGDLQFLPSIIYNHVEDKEKNTHSYVGANLYIGMPTGNYTSARLVNIGEHRWWYKPQVAIGQRLMKVVTLEAVANVVIYGDNDSYLLRGATSSIHSLKQNPTFNAELHASVDVHASAYLSLSYYAAMYGQRYLDTKQEIEPSATVHSLRFTWGIRITPQTLALLQFQQDLSAGGDYSNTRFFGARLSHVFF